MSEPSQSQARGTNQTPWPNTQQGSTSWFDAAGKDRHPMSQPRHKQLEQPNSVRETLFLQSGRGDQNFKQDTS